MSSAQASADYSRRLGVCIPTYKRPEQLRRCVRSVIAAAEPHAVPIFVVDDSTDATNRTVVRGLQSEYRHVIYVANTRNLGIDGNIVRSVDLCGCEYAWLLGEDDRMTTHGVGRVLEALAEGRPAFLCVNYAAVDESITFVRRDRMLPLHEDTRIAAAAFLSRHAWAIGFIGACVVNKALWSGVDSRTYAGTYFAHVGTIMESIRGQEVTIVAEPLILNRWGPATVATWAADSDAVFNGWKEMTDRLHAVYGPAPCAAAAAAFVRGHGLDTLRFLCVRRADGLYTAADYHARIRLSNRRWPYKLAAWLIAACGRRAFRGARAFLNWSRRRRGRRLVGYTEPEGGGVEASA